MASRAKEVSWERLEVVAPGRDEPPPKKRVPRGVGPKRVPEGELSKDARRMVANLSAYGFNLRQILEATGLNKTQLRSCKAELVGASTRKDLAVVDSAFLQATGGGERGKWTMADGSMTRFWLTHRLGWRPPPERRLELSANVDLNRLTDDQLMQLEHLVEAASAPPEEAK